MPASCASAGVGYWQPTHGSVSAEQRAPCGLREACCSSRIRSRRDVGRRRGCSRARRSRRARRRSERVLVDRRGLRQQLFGRRVAPSRAVGRGPAEGQAQERVGAALGDHRADLLEQRPRRGTPPARAPASPAGRRCTCRRAASRTARRAGHSSDLLEHALRERDDQHLAGRLLAARSRRSARRSATAAASAAPSRARSGRRRARRASSTIASPIERARTIVPSTSTPCSAPSSRASAIDAAARPSSLVELRVERLLERHLDHVQRLDRARRPPARA